MEKDKTILDFIENLKLVLDFALLKVVDNWPSDMCSIGLQKGSKLIYISTFNFVYKNELKYDYDLELIDGSDETNINVLQEGRGVTEIELTKEIRAFLEV